MRFEANKYGSFAANNVASPGEGADDAYADGSGTDGMHQRVISQRVDHDDEENGLDEEQPTAKPELGRPQDNVLEPDSSTMRQQ